MNAEEMLLRAGDGVTEEEWRQATKKFALRCKERGGFNMDKKDGMWFLMERPFNLIGFASALEALGGTMIESPYSSDGFIGVTFE